MTMLLLPTGTAVRSRPAMLTDEHGWTLPDPAGGPTVTLDCSLQAGPGIAFVGADERGGSGPYGPSVAATGTVYLAADADVLPGDALTIDGTTWQVRTVRNVPDPSGGDAGCRIAEVAA